MDLDELLDVYMSM